MPKEAARDIPPARYSAPLTRATNQKKQLTIMAAIPTYKGKPIYRSKAKAKGFSRGTKAVQAIYSHLRDEIMDVLGVENATYFPRISRERTLNQAEYEAIKKIFERYGITNELDMFDRVYR